MPTVRIEERGCRGCTLCVELCPVKVFEFREAEARAVVGDQERCIGCLSCFYVCPSQCIEVDEYVRLRPFHRLEEHAELLRKFLQTQPLAETLTEADVDEAWSDVTARLAALSDTVLETIGTGYRAVGRRSGAMAANHMPEMYEQAGLELVLQALQRRFAHAFSFEYKLGDGSADLTFRPCGLCRVVETQGGKVGDAVLCKLFHDYWAGLLSAFVGTRYKCDVPVAGPVCEMRIAPVE